MSKDGVAQQVVFDFLLSEALDTANIAIDEVFPWLWKIHEISRKVTCGLLATNETGYYYFSTGYY